MIVKSHFEETTFPLIKSNFDFPNLSMKRDFLLGEICLNYAAFALVPEIHFPFWNISNIKAAAITGSQENHYKIQQDKLMLI